MQELQPANASWVLTSASFVLLTTLGLAFFYGGLVRQKNVLSTLGHTFFILALVSVQWVLIGYSLAFGPDRWGLIGGLDWLGLAQIGIQPSPYYASTVSQQAHVFTELTVAVLTSALITSAFAERGRFKTVVLFSVLWTTLVYDPVAHWAWGHLGWMGTLKVLDFAGGTVVHISGGVSALVAAWVLGPRLRSQEPREPHDATMTLLGTGLLWLGWFGFTGGNALVSNAEAGSVLVTTNTSAATAMLTWLAVSWARRQQPSVLGGAMGAFAGLVAITPAAGFVSPAAAILIGFGAGLFCYAAVQFKHRFTAHDPLDAWPVHVIGGIWGALATGLFASAIVNSAGGDGLLAGNPRQLINQGIGVVVVMFYAGGMTWLILKLLGRFMRLRVAETEEELGLDVTQHGESAYTFYQDLTRRLLAAREEERRNIAYEVHDGLAQIVSSTHQHLQAYAHQHPAESPEAQAKLTRTMELAQRAIREARRIIANLRPTDLDDFGLAAAIRLQAEELRRDGWEITYHETLGPDRLPAPVETALFAVARESLTNVRKHAQTSNVNITLERQGHAICLEVQDWGRGFTPMQFDSEHVVGNHLGLVGMRERIASLGGYLTVESAPGRGTLVIAEVPLSKESQKAVIVRPDSTDGNRH